MFALSASPQRAPACKLLELDLQYFAVEFQMRPDMLSARMTLQHGCAREHSPNPSADSVFMRSASSGKVLRRVVACMQRHIQIVAAAHHCAAADKALHAHLSGGLHIAHCPGSQLVLGRLKIVTTLPGGWQLYLFAHAGVLRQSESLSNSWMVVDTPDAADPHQNTQIATQPERPSVLSMVFHQAQHKGEPSSNASQLCAWMPQLPAVPMDAHLHMAVTGTCKPMTA